MLNWIKNNCSFCWVEIENSDICHLTEALIISVLRERTEPLLNS